MAQQLATAGSAAAGGTPEPGASRAMQRQPSMSYSRRMSLSSRPSHNVPSSPRGGGGGLADGLAEAAGEGI